MKSAIAEPGYATRVVMYPAWTVRPIKAVFLIVYVGAFILTGCTSPSTSERFSFTDKGNRLVGQLHLPAEPGPHPAVIIVHGDGATPWDGHGYYMPFIRWLNEAGFAALSWDKPGVGRSAGDWVAQSMQDRANELVSAAEALRRIGATLPLTILTSWALVRRVG